MGFYAKQNENYKLLDIKQY